MSELLALWMPILVSAVGIFFASFVSWVIIGHHNPDWAVLPDEDENVKRLGELHLPPGRYLFPCARTKEDMEDETKKALIASGPWGTINVWSGAPHMEKNMGLTFVFYLVTAVFVGYLGTLALKPGAGFSKVFRVTGTAAILAHCFAFMPNNIWFGTPKRAILMDVLDGVVYGLITGAVFGALWP
jgi:hypothetical protein